MEIFIVIVIILIASILQTSTGFGFSILATPFLLFIFEPMEAIQINIILSLVISFALINKIKKDIDYGILRRFVIGSALGLPIGIIIFLALDLKNLIFGISLVILVLTILLILKYRIAQTNSKDIVIGGLSGVLTSSIGMPGPPLLLYFSGTDTKKEKLRSTTLAFYLFIYSMSLVIQVIFVGTNRTIWMTSGFALPLVLLGLYLGQVLFKKINQRFFRIFTYIILLFTGIYLLAESW
ncbi:sulfite exporter TauE/SafE family protein [Paenisporosarcina sp. TG20]|uniref:sulfite exporter TauE/SafE family protein n=1 Tax=Paenisporosarcina sp. TG20 TaxID=1211706 RepID=UPI0002DF4EAB|nr:sulfite exporter TauE/SafE family protein [Paenisporosarcina sp. TG20]